ncbi:DUF3883 domain-containing protein [Thioclava sp. IC9]|uniref:protein NO VEIN domain-containing protein n=1 Tax=Thioclava sp. IC9 TaxID=1973007 RepID=UPI000B542FAC|nr:DUF3883 domain-containing protein [Thioclava sp. IC9]OWX99360.1 hypothetical protein B6V76_18155 [Thioclava sp. IC9]
MRPALLTPSAAYACIDLLAEVTAQRLTLSELKNLHFPSISAQTVVDNVTALGWVIEEADGSVATTHRGQECLNLNEATEQLRFLLSDYFLLRRDPWLQLARRGRIHVLLQAPPEIAQLLHEAQLAEGEQDYIVRFWDDLADRIRGDRDRNRTEVGRTGERLSLAYETKRTGKKPRWVALDSDEFGYDLLSQTSETDLTLTKIECKCSERTLAEATLYLTRHEWETADSSERYYFHLWNIASHKTRLAIVSVEDMRQHIPENKNRGSWEAVQVPFLAFAPLFASS